MMLFFFIVLLSDVRFTSQAFYNILDLGNFLNKKLAGLAILSGQIMNNKPIKNSILQETPIFISHGKKDEVIPVSSFFQAIEFLNTNKCNFESHILAQDGDNISPDTINLLQNFIKKNL